LHSEASDDGDCFHILLFKNLLSITHSKLLKVLKASELYLSMMHLGRQGRERDLEDVLEERERVCSLYQQAEERLAAVR